MWEKVIKLLGCTVVVYKPFPSGSILYMLRNVAEVIKYLGCSGLQNYVLSGV